MLLFVFGYPIQFLYVAAIKASSSSRFAILLALFSPPNKALYTKSDDGNGSNSPPQLAPDNQKLYRHFLSVKNLLSLLIFLVITIMDKDAVN